MVADGNNRTVKSGKTLLSVVEELYAIDDPRLIDVARSLDLSKSTVHRHIATLEEEEYVVVDDGIVHLSTKFLRLGNFVRYRNDVYRKAEPIVEDLASQTQERANFYIEEHGRAVCLHRQVGDHGVLAKTEIGRSFPMHATAAGKAILSGLPRDRVWEIIDRHGLPAATEKTVTDPESLFDELEQIRAEGLSYNDEEHVEKLRAIGVPVHDEHDEVAGALTVSGPSKRLVGDLYETELPTVILGAANELEIKIEYSS